MSLSILIGIAYTPLMTELLGQNEYGLYSTITSTISMMSILNLGLSSSYIRYFSKFKYQKDYVGLAKLNGMFISIFSVIGIVACVIGFFLSFHLEWIFSAGLTEKEYVIAKKLMILLTFNVSLSFPLSIFALIVSANERFVVLKIVGMLKTVAAPLLTIPLLLLGFKSVAMAFVIIIVSVLADIFYMVYVIFGLKEKFVFRGFSGSLLKDLFLYTSFIAINLIVDQVNWNVDRILLGRFKGTASVAVYSIGYILCSYYINFSTAISSLFVPRIHNIVNETKNDLQSQRQQLSELFIKVGRVQLIILGLICSGLVFWGKEFIVNFWVGDKYCNSYIVMIILVLPSTIPLIQNLGIEIQRAQNNHRFRSIVYLIMAFVNIVISIKLCQRYGEIGSAFGTGISLILANGFIMNIYYHKKCNIDIIKFWKSIVKLSKGFIIPSIVGVLIVKYLSFDTIFMFILGILVYTVIYVISMWIFGMNEEERELMIKPIKRILKSRR